MTATYDGSCSCGRLRFRMTARPIVVNACHCRDCQRLTGSAFAVNGMIEADRIVLEGRWMERDRAGQTPGHRRWQCADCGVLLMAEHRLFGDAMRFVRLGTLDHGEQFPPDAHFFVRSKHPWVTIPDGVPAFDTLPGHGLGVDLLPEASRRMQAGGGRTDQEKRGDGTNVSVPGMSSTSEAMTGFACPDRQESATEAAWQARYGGGAPPQALPWNETVALLLGHRSVRAYRSDSLPDGTLPLLVAAAQSAATSSNMQAWSVVAVTDPASKSILARIAADQKHIEQCPLFMVFLADLSRAGRVAERQGAPLGNLPYLETFLVAAIDAALAAQNAVVAAESLGLSTVYIGALRNDPDAVSAELDLPAGTVAVFGLCVGYAAESAAAGVRPRLPQQAVLHDGRYAHPDEASLIDDYDRVFEASPHGGGGSWTARVRNRLGDIGRLAGRERIRATLNRLGFPLR